MEDMNIPLFDSISCRQRCRTWTPLITQQLRLRHLYQVIVYNVAHDPTDGFYYTLHSTAMCAPFYTSETLVSRNPKWPEFELRSDQTNVTSTALVLRIWQKSSIILTWGVNLSGLVYLGTKLSDIQPDSFLDNTVILHLRGGYFTGLAQVRTDLGKQLPFAGHANIVAAGEEQRIFRTARAEFPANDVRGTYNVEKLRAIHSLQIGVRNNSRDVETLKAKINSRIEPGTNGGGEAADAKVSNDCNVRYAPQLLTMTSLNKMLQDKPTRVQKQEIIRIRREIESCKLKTKILSQERDRKQAILRHLKHQYNNVCDNNEERNSQLMEDYRCLCKEMERLREWKREHWHQKEILQQTTLKLHNRRRQLMSELLLLYPIIMVNESKYTINGIYLPSSDKLSDCSEGGLSVALGYVTHVLIMCASFLQVPLRYPLQHFGSRSVIEDYISATMWEKTREFPLYTKGKDHLQFNYAVYLLNKNIAQYLYLLGAKTPDLKETLPNLMSLLQIKDNQKHEPGTKGARTTETNAITDTMSLSSEDVLKYDKVFFGSTNNVSDPILDCLKHENHIERCKSPTHSAKKRERSRETGPGLSQILAIPEAFMNQQMSTNTFKSYMSFSVDTMESSSSQTDLDCSLSKIPARRSRPQPIPDRNCDIKIHTSRDDNGPAINGTQRFVRENDRLSRSVGSYTDESRYAYELGSEPLLDVSPEKMRNCASQDLSNIAEVSHQDFLQKWLEGGPRVLGESERTVRTDDSPLTSRTDALLKTKSFNLVKPKF